MLRPIDAIYADRRMRRGKCGSAAVSATVFSFDGEKFSYFTGTNGPPSGESEKWLAMEKEPFGWQAVQVCCASMGPTSST